METVRSPEELEALLGEKVRALRLQRNVTRAELAEFAGISAEALRNLETGRGSTLKTLVHAVRALGQEAWLENLSPTITTNPLHMTAAKSPRQRARRRRADGDE